MQIKVQDFVCGRRMNRERVTACQVLLDFLVEQKHLYVPVDGDGRYQKAPFKAAYRNVQRCLADFAGCGKRKGNLVPSPQNNAKKHHYLKPSLQTEPRPQGRGSGRCTQMRATSMNTITGIYDSLFNPDDNEDVIYQKEKHKGRRYCFCAAIQGPNHPLGSEAPEDLAGLVPGSIWAFCPQKKADHQGDYHKVFNGDNYIAWFRDQLIVNLHQASLIMIDNVAYHCVYGEGVPQWYRMKKQECINYLSSKSVPSF
jgi:hypothetical protein